MFRKTTELHMPLKVLLIHGQFSKCGHVIFRCFTEHVPASLLPELFRQLTEIFLTVYYTTTLSSALWLNAQSLLHWSL